MDKLRDTLIPICQKHTFATGHRAVIHEPYIPYIPPSWNGILVLAEAQNLGLRTSGAYVDWLRSRTPSQRIFRLSKRGENIVVGPWDDGRLKLALEASLRCSADEAAVSNGVLWSLVDKNGNNANPDKDLVLAFRVPPVVAQPRIRSSSAAPNLVFPGSKDQRAILSDEGRAQFDSQPIG